MLRIALWILLVACAALPAVAGAAVPLDRSFASIPILPSDQDIADAAAAELSAPPVYTSLSASNSYGSGAPYLSSAVLALETGSAGSGGLEIDDAALSVSSWQSGSSRVVTGWTDTSGRGNHLRAASLATAPQARPSPSLSGLPMIMFRGSSLIREMSLLVATNASTSSSIQGMPVGAAERTLSMVVRFVSASGHDQCGIQSDDTSATGKEFIAAPGGFSYGSISASGLKSSFGVGSNLRNEFVASASGFSLASMTWGAEVSGDKDLSNTTVPTDSWGVLTTVVRADPLGVAGTIEAKVYWNTVLVAAGKIAQVNTQLPFSSEAPVGGVDATTYAGNSLDEPTASFDPLSKQSWTSPYGFGALVGLSTSSSSSNASSFTPGFISLGGSQNFSSCMDVAAVVVYNVALSVAQQADLDNYLGAKWLSRQAPFNTMPAGNPSLPLLGSIVLNLQADVGLVLSSAASLKSWRDQSESANDLYVAFANYSAAALWSYPASPYAPAAVGGSDNPNQMLLRPTPGAQSIRSVFGVGPAGGGVLIRRNALNGLPVLHMRAGQPVQRLQQRMVGYSAGTAVASTVSLATPAATFGAATPATPLHGGLLRGAPSPGQELRNFPTAVADRTLVTLMRFLPGSSLSAAYTATTASRAACASGIYFGRNSRSDNDRTAGNTTAKGIFTDGYAQGMGVGFTSSLLPASTLLSPTVSDSATTFPASTSSSDFFIHTLVWKSGVESSYLNGTLVGTRVLPLASAFTSISSSDASFVVNSGLPVANLALAKRLNPSLPYSAFNSSLDLNTGCGADIEVAAVLLYNRALLDPEHAIVTGYLASKYFGATSGFGNTDASYPERIGGGNAVQTRVQAVNASIVSSLVPTRLELVGEGFGRSVSDLTGAGVTFGPVSGQEYVCDSALWKNSTALTCTLSPSVLKSSDLSLSFKFVAWINWKPSVASVSLLSFAPATLANSFQVRGTTAATKLPEGSFLKLEVRSLLSLTAAVNLTVSVSSSGTGAAAPRLPTVVSPASGVVGFPLRAAWSPAYIAEISVYAGWCTVSGGSGASCVLTVSFAIPGPNPQSLVAPSDVVVTVSGAPFSTAVTSAIYASAGDKYGCSSGATARDLDVTLADSAHRMHFCSSLRVAALSASWIEFDVWPQLSGIAQSALLSLKPSSVLSGSGSLSLTVSWTKSFDSVASSFASQPAALSASTQTIVVTATMTTQSFDVATVINAALGSVKAQSSSPPLRLTVQLAYNSGSELQFDVDAVKMDITWMSSLSVSGFPQVLFPNQLSPPLTLTFNGRLPADAQVSVNPSWGWMGSSRSTSSINLAASSSNSIVQRRGDTVAFQTFSSGLGVQTSASMDFSVSVKGVLSGLPVSDMSSVSMPSIQLAPSVPSFASLAQSSPGVLGSRQGFGLVVDPVADKIFVIGGYNRDSSAQINSVYMSQDAASWTLMAAPSFTPRESFCSLVFPPAAGATNSIIVIMGGLGSGGPLQDAHRTTDGGVSWSAQSAPGWSPARSKMGCTLHSDGFAYMIAGQSSGGTLNDVWRSPDGVAWTQVSVSAGAPFAARSGAALLSFQGNLLLMSCAAACSKMDISADGTVWRQATFGGEIYAAVNGQRALAFMQRDANTLYSSTDGEHWNCMGIVAIDPLTRPAVAVFQGRLLIVGTAAGKQTAVWIAHAQLSEIGSPLITSPNLLSRRTSAAFASDPVTGVSVVAGGNTAADFMGASLNDCWCTLDGVNWRQSTSAAQWDARAAAPMGFLTRTGFPSVLIFTGGISGTTTSAGDVWMSADLGSSWIQLADAPVQRYSAATVQYRGALLIISGYEFYNMATTDVWRASWPDGATDVLWELLCDPIPFYSRAGAAAVVANDIIVLTGGYAMGYSQYLNDVWMSVDGTVWNEVLAAAPWTARNLHGIVQLPNNGLLLFGGTDGSVNIQDCWASAGGAAHWMRSMQCGVPAQADFSTLSLRGVPAMVVGGVRAAIVNDVFTIQSATSWSCLFGSALPVDKALAVSTPASALSSVRAQSNLLFDSTSNVLLLLNGYTGSAATPSMYRSTNNGVSWSLVTASVALPARYSAGAAFVHAVGCSVAIVCGGLDSTGTAQGDCWSSTTATGQPLAASWSQVNTAAAFGVRSGHSLLSVGDNTLVLLAGRGAAGVPSDDVWSSVDLGASWSRVCLSPFPTRDRHGAASQSTLMAMPNGQQQNRGGSMPVLMVAGGVSSASSAYLNDVHVSFDAGSSWLQLPTAPWLARQGHQLVAAAGVWYVVGGQADPAVFSTLTLQDAWLTVDGVMWSCLTAAATHMGQRLDFAAIAFASDGSVSPTLLAVGGRAAVSPASAMFDDAWSIGPLMDPPVLVLSYSFSRLPDAHATLFKEWSGAELTDGLLVQGIAAVHDGSIGWLSSVRITFRFSSAVMLSAMELGYSVHSGASVAPLLAGIELSMDGGLSFFSVPLDPVLPQQMPALPWHNSLLVPLASGSRSRAMQVRLHLRPPTGSLLPFVLDEVTFFGVPVGPFPRSFVPPSTIAPSSSGWFDVIGQGVPNDYCLFLSALDSALQCQLSGPLGVSQPNQLSYAAGSVTQNLCYDVQCDASFACQNSTGLCSGGRASFQVTASPSSYTCGSTISFLTVTPPQAPTSSVTLSLLVSSPHNDLIASPSSMTFVNADPQFFNLTYPACHTATNNATAASRSADLSLSFALSGPSAPEFITPSARTFSSLQPSASIYLTGAPAWLDSSADHVLRVQVVLATSFYLLHPDAIVTLQSSAGVVDPALLTFTAANEDRRTVARSITWTLPSAVAASLTSVTLSARVGGNALVLSSQFALSSDVRIILQSAEWSVPSLARTAITAGFVSGPVALLPPFSLRTFPVFVMISVADGLTPALLADAMPVGRLLPATSLRVRVDSAAGASFRLLPPASAIAIGLLFAVEATDQFSKGVSASASVTVWTPCAASSIPPNGGAGTCARPTAVNATCSITCNTGFRISGAPLRCGAGSTVLTGAQSCVVDASVMAVSPLELPVALSSFSSASDPLGVSQSLSGANLSFAHPTSVSVLLQPTGWFMLQAIDVSYSASVDSERLRVAGVEVSVDQINFYSLSLPSNIDQLFSTVDSRTVRIPLPSTPIRALRIYLNFATAGNSSFVVSQLSLLGSPFLPSPSPSPPVALSSAASVCPSLLPAPGWFDAQMTGAAVDFCYLIGSACADAYISCQLATSAYAQTPRGQFRYDAVRTQLYQDPCFYRNDSCSTPILERALYISSIPVQPYVNSISYGLTVQAAQQIAPLLVSLLFAPVGCARVIGGDSFWLIDRVPRSLNLSNPSSVAPCTVSVAAVGLSATDLPPAAVIRAIQPASVLSSGISSFVNAGQLSPLSFTLSSPPRLPPLTLTLSLSAGGGNLSASTYTWTTLTDASAFSVNYTAPVASATPITLALRLTSYAAGASAVLPWLDADPTASSTLSPAGGYAFATSYTWQISPPCTGTPTAIWATMDPGCPASVLSGTSCPFTCDSGTGIQGAASMTCMGGSWIADGTCMASFILPISLSVYRFEAASFVVSVGRVPSSNVTLVVTASDPTTLIMQSSSTLRFSSAVTSAALNFTCGVSGQYNLSFVVGGADSASFLQPPALIVRVLEQATFVLGAVSTTLYSQQVYTLPIQLSEPANYSGVALVAEMPSTGTVSTLSYLPRDASMVTAGLPLSVVTPWTLSPLWVSLNFTVTGSDRAHFRVPDAMLLNVVPCLNVTVIVVPYFYVKQSTSLTLSEPQPSLTSYIDYDIYSRTITSSGTVAWFSGSALIPLPVFSVVDVMTVRFGVLDEQLCPLSNLTIPVLPQANVTVLGLRADRTYYQNQFVDGLTIEVTEAPLIAACRFIPTLWDNVNSFSGAPILTLPLNQTTLAYSFTVPKQPKSNAALIASFIATGQYTLKIRFTIPPGLENPHYAVPADILMTILAQSYLNITNMPISLYSLQRAQNISMSVKQPINVGTNLTVTFVVSPAGAVVISPPMLLFTPGASVLNFTMTAAMLTSPAIVTISMQLGGTDAPHYLTPTPRVLGVLSTSALMAANPPVMQVSPSTTVVSCDPFSIDIASSVAVQYGLARSYVWSLINITYAQGPLMGQLDSHADGALLESVLNSSSIDSGVGLGYTFGSFSAGHTLLSFPAHLLTMNRIYTFGALIGGLPNTSVPTWSADSLFWSSASLTAIHIVPPPLSTMSFTGPATLRRDQDALYTVTLPTTCSPNVFANVSFTVADLLAPETSLYSPAISFVRTLSIAKHGSLLLAGHNYTITATVTLFDQLDNILDVTAASLNTSITRMPLVASILGGNQIRAVDVNFTLDASASYDPDTIGLAAPPPLLFNWTCFSQNATAGLTSATLPTSGYNTSCSAALLPFSTAPVFEVDGALTAGDTIYQFTLSLLDTDSGRTASAVQLVWVRFAAPYPDPVIMLSSPIAQTRVNPQDAIIIQSAVTLSPNVSTNPSALIYAWRVTILPLASTPALSATALALPVNSIARGWLARNGFFGLNQAQYLGHADSDFGYVVSDPVLAELEGNLTAFADWQAMVQDPSEVAFTALGGNLLLANPALRLSSPVATAATSDPKDLSLRPGLLLPGYSYRFTCHVTDPGAAGIGGESENTFDMHVNAPPSGGACSAVVDNTETAGNSALAVLGLSSVNVTCSGWSDEDTAMPLTYSMASTYRYPNGSLASVTPLSPAGPTALRTGLVLAQNRTYQVISTVRDSEGAHHSVVTELKVPFWAPLVTAPAVANISNSTNTTIVVPPTTVNVTANSSSTDAFHGVTLSLCELTNITQMLLLPSLYQQKYGQSLNLLVLLSTLLSQVNASAPTTDLTVMCQGPPVASTIISGLGPIVNSSFASNTQSITLILQTINNLNFTSVDLSALEDLMQQILGRLYGSTLNGTHASGPGILMTPQQNTDILQSLADVLSHYFGAGDCAAFNSSLAVTLQLADALLLGSTPLPDAPSVMLITENFLVGTQRARMVSGIRTELAWRPWDQNRTVTTAVKAGFGMLDVSLSSAALDGLVVAKQIADLSLTPDPKVDVVMLQFHSDWNRCRPGGMPLGSATHLILRDSDTHLPLDFTGITERVYFKQRARVEIVPSSIPTNTLAPDGVTFLQEVIPAFPMESLTFCNFSYMPASGQINPSADAGVVLSAAEMAFNADRCPVSCSFVNEQIRQYAGFGCSVSSVLPPSDGVSTHLEVTCACNHLTEFSLLYDRDTNHAIILGDDPPFETSSAVYLVFLCLYSTVALCTLYELVRIVKNAACEQWVLLGAHVVLLLVAATRIVGQYYLRWGMQHTSLSSIGALMIVPQSLANVLWFLLLYLWASIRIHRVITPATVATSAAGTVSLVPNISADTIASPSAANSSSSASTSPVALLVKDVDPFIPLRSLFGGLNCVGVLCGIVLFAKLGFDSTEDARRLDLVLAAVVMLLISAASVLTLLVYASWLIRSLPKPIPPARVFSPWTYLQKRWGHSLCALWCAMIALVLYSFLHVNVYLSKVHRLNAGYLSMDILQLLVCLYLLKVLVNPLYEEGLARRAKRHLSTRKQVLPPPQQKSDWRLGSTRDLLDQTGSSSSQLTATNDATNAFAALKRPGSQFTTNGLLSPSSGSPAAASGVALSAPPCDSRSKGRAPCHAVAVSGLTDSLTLQMMEAATLNGCIESGQYLPDAVLDVPKKLSNDPSKFVLIPKEHSAETSRTGKDDTKSHWKFIKMAQQKQAERDAAKAAAAFEASVAQDQAATPSGAASAEGVVTPNPANGPEGETEEEEQARLQNHRWLISAWFNDTQAPAQGFRHQRFVPGQTAVGGASAQTAAGGRALPGDAPAYQPAAPAPTAAASRRSAPPSGTVTPGAVMDDADIDSDVQWSPNPAYQNPADEVGDELTGGGASGYATPRAGARSVSASNTPGSKSISTNDVMVLKSGSATPVHNVSARAHIRSSSGVAPEASGPIPSHSPPIQSRRGAGVPLVSKSPPASQKNLFSHSVFSEQFVPAKNAPGTVARRSSSDKKKVKQPAAATSKAATAGNTPSRKSGAVEVESSAATKPQHSVPSAVASRPLDFAGMTVERPAGDRGSARRGPASPAKRVLDFTVEQVPSARSIHFNPNPGSAVDGGLATNRDVQDDPELLRAFGLPLDTVAAQAGQPASAAPLAPASMRVTEVQQGGAAASSSSAAILVAAKAPQPQSALFGAFTPSPPPAPFVSGASSVFAPNAEVTGVASFAPPPTRIVTSGMVVAPNPPPGIAASKVQTPRHHPSPSMPLSVFTLPPSALRSPAVSPTASPPQQRASPSNSRVTSSIPSGAAGDSISYQNRLNGMSLDDSGNLHAGLAALTSPDNFSELSAMPSSGVLNRAGLIKAPSRGTIGLVDPQLIVPTRPKSDSPVIMRPRPLRTTSSGGEGLLNRTAPASPSSSATLAAASVRTPMGAGVGPAGAAPTFASSAVSRSSPRPRMSPPPGITKPPTGAK